MKTLALAKGNYEWAFALVPIAGLEPARLKTLDFESSTSANSITSAKSDPKVGNELK